jgi:beta-N-acetylhexosaminidase
MDVTRRRFLEIASLTALGVALEACGLAASPTPSPGGRSPSPSLVPASPSPSPVPSPSPSPAPSPTSSLTLRQKAAGLLVVGFRGSTVRATDPIARAIAQDGLGGVILFDRDQLTGRPRNILSPAQVTDLTGSVRDLAGGRRLLVATDQEGGRVARLTPANGFPATVSQADIGRQDDPAAAEAVGRRTAKTLRSAGIDWNLAPVVDLDVDPTNPSIGALGRSFSADPDVVVAMAEAIIRGHRAEGVLTTLKHFPGIGSATGDTDRGFVDVTRTWDPVELAPFRRLVAAGSADTVMVGNVLDGQLDPKRPASLSRATVTGSLRGDVGWTGVVVTDDLQAGAIRDGYADADAIELALAAGNDVLLLANQQIYVADAAQRAIDVIVGLVAAGRISEERLDASLARIEAAASTTFG